MSTSPRHQHTPSTDGSRDPASRSEFLRNRAVVNAILEGENVAGAARRHGMSRQWAHELKRRYETEGEAGLLPRSRRAHRIPNRTGAAIRRRVVELRLELDAAGPDAGPESIAARLEREGTTPPANSTIHRILTDAGLVRPEPRKRPRSSYTRFEAALPNETWQSDFTHWPLADGTDALIVSWLDDHSRFLLLSRAFASVTAATIGETFLAACGEYGIPASTLTDNGGVYTTRLRSCEPGPFERLLALMGVRRKNGRPYHPQTQGKIERWHRTLKQWLAARPLAADLDALDRQLDEFRRGYNEERPHRALGRRTPREAYEARGKAGPDPGLAAREQARRDEEERRRAMRDAGAPARARARTAVAGAPDVTVPPRLHRVDRRGCVRQRIAGGNRTFGVGAGRAGGLVELEVVRGLVVVVDALTGEVLAERVLDTGRDYQSRRPVPGVDDVPGQG